jgi:hypothetical protein
MNFPPFTAFLENHKVPRGSKEWTHSSLGNPTGIFNINDDEYDRFLNLYQASKDFGGRLHMTERHLEASPILIDLDFKQTDHERLYTDSHIEEIILSIQCILKDITENSINENNLAAYILEKGDAPRSYKDGFKDGVHIIFPFFHSKPDLQFELRKQIVDFLPNVFPADIFTNSWDDIYDKSVIQKNGWFLYGSNKPDERDSWKLTGILRASMGYIEIHDLPSENELLPLLSIRKEPDCIYKMLPIVSTTRAVVNAASNNNEIIIRPQDTIDFNKLNEVMQTDTEWEVNSHSPGCLQLSPTGRCNCLVNPEYYHNDARHSTMYVTQNNVTIFCFSHNSRSVDKAMADKIKAIVLGTTQEKKETPFKILRNKILSIGAENNYRKLNGYIYKQIKPCAFVPDKSYDDFIRSTMRGDSIYNDHPRFFKLLQEFLKNYDEDGLRDLEINRDIISFEDGVFVLSKAEFVPYPADEFDGQCARHHIKTDFIQDSYETPLFDKLVKYQMSDDVYYFFIASVGRLFFPVGFLDNWQFMLMLYGNAGSGKGTVLDIFKSMFAGHQVVCMTNNMEHQFGLDGKQDKELLMIYDSPQDMQNVIDQHIWQSMVTGEDVQVPRKNAQPIYIKWDVPQIWASNEIPNYKDNSGSVSRRLMMFDYRKDIEPADKDTELKSKIISTELPGILKKCIEAYLEYSKKYKGIDVWSFCPQRMKDNQDLIRGDTDYLFNFLKAHVDDNCTETSKYRVIYAHDSIVSLAKLKDAFRRVMKFKNIKCKFPELYAQTLRKIGCRCDAISICRSCDQPAKKGCCNQYSSTNRSCKEMITGMKLEVETIDSDH